MAHRSSVAKWLAVAALFILSCLSFTFAQEGSSSGAPTSTPSSSATAPTATSTGNATLSVCPPPFIENTMNILSSACTAACCMPCPAAQVFYEKDALTKSFTAVASVRAVSGVGVTIVLISYLVLPGRRNHPHFLILLFVTCMFPNQILGSMWLFQGKSTLCKNDFEATNMTNNLTCAAQGIGMIYTILTMAMLAAILICNLHLLAVHRSSIIQRNLGKLEIISFILPLSSALYAGITHKVESTGFGSFCFASPDIANAIFFLPLIVIIGFGSAVHLCTIFYMIKTVFSLGNSTSTSASASRSINDQLGGGGGGGGSDLSKLSPSRVRKVRVRELMTLLKQQWRPALFVSLFMLADLIYWTVYKTEISKLKKIDPLTTLGYQDWIQCLKTEQFLGTNPDITQTKCSKIAAPFVPRPWVTTISDMAPAIFGTCVFLIFMSKKEIWLDWKDFFLTCGGGGEGGSRRSNKNLFELKSESPTPPVGGLYQESGNQSQQRGDSENGHHENNHHQNRINLKHSYSLRYGSEEALSKPDSYSQVPSYYSVTDNNNNHHQNTAVLGGGIRKVVGKQNQKNGSNMIHQEPSRSESRQQYYNGAEDDDYYLGRSSGGFVASDQVAMTRLGNNTTLPRQNSVQNGSIGGLFNMNDLDSLDLNLTSLPKAATHGDQKLYHNTSISKNYGKNINQILSDGNDRDLYSTVQTSTSIPSSKTVGWRTNSITSNNTIGEGSLPLYSPPHSSAISTHGSSRGYMDSVNETTLPNLYPSRAVSPPPHIPSKNRNRRN